MRRAVANLIGLAVVGAVSPALATDVRVGTCISTARWTFTPPLTQVVRSGTARLEHTVSCVYAGASTESPSEYVTLAFGGSPAEYAYVGNCVQALLDTVVDVTATLLGGTVLVVVDRAPIPIASTFVLHPDEVCNQASAVGSGVIADLLTE